ncbi:cyclin-D3-2-like [Typha latifolia]|uniref:cyclin-D3-2-like n=1 Tax=Typha latifolia TaxID=4733 RepID=UPI003C2AE868
MALSSLLDPLYCQEEHLELDQPQDQDFETQPSKEDDLLEFYASLTAKESQTHPELREGDDGFDNHHPYLYSARKEAVDWVEHVAAHHGFSALTVLLAVNYLDRCFLHGGGALRLRSDKPWMGRFAAVACLSLAAKVEETRVPLLLDLQVPVDEVGHVFESKTVRRMELLVLSTLGWRLNPVTPLSFIHPLLCSSSDRLQWCESILLSILADLRWVRYSASVWAAALLLYTTTECDESHQLLTLLNVHKEKVEECYQIVVEYMGNAAVGSKRKHFISPLYYYSSSSNSSSSPSSPSGVIGSCLSCESSSSSGEWQLPPLKRPNCSVIAESGEEI